MAQLKRQQKHLRNYTKRDVDEEKRQQEMKSEQQRMLQTMMDSSKKLLLIKSEMLGEVTNELICPECGYGRITADEASELEIEWNAYVDICACNESQ